MRSSPILLWLRPYHHTRSNGIYIVSSLLITLCLPWQCRAFLPKPSYPCRSLHLELHSSSDESQPNTKFPDDPRTLVVCVGETLYDSLPDAIYLGGAPTNVAVHLSSMGVPTAVASCVGRDQLGDDAVRRMEDRGVQCCYVQRHERWSTGMVVASIDPKTGDATYKFETPAAWDGLELTSELRRLILQQNDGMNGHQQHDGVIAVIGTIASRLGSEAGATSAATVAAVRDIAADDSVVLDVNLRPPWYDSETIVALSRGSAEGKRLALLKLNDEELPILEAWCNSDDKSDSSDDCLSGERLRSRLVTLAKALNARRVCVTRGADGAALWCEGDDNINGFGTFAESQGFSCEKEAGCDTVGAGDAFLAALVRSLLVEKEDPNVALKKACALGGFVASCRGAVPDHNKAPRMLQDIFANV